MDNNDLHALLRTMVECGASDLYLTTGAVPKVKIDGKVQTLPLPSLQSGQVRKLAYSALTPQAIADPIFNGLANISGKQSIGGLLFSLGDNRRALV